MAKFSNNLLNKLTQFLTCEIGSGALSGITYAMALKDDKNKDLHELCKAIKREVKRCGFEDDEVFRIYEVTNGYIYDMDLSVAKKITYEISKVIAKNNDNKTPVGDLIGDRPSKRRKDDMLGLAKFVKKEYDSGNRKIEVALFSKNSVPRIIITGEGPNREMLHIKYNAYAIRHWDIEAVNSSILIPAGIRIARLEPCEILPSKTGVKFILDIEKI